MVARGRLIGVLCLGGKRSGESYAPDESAAIETLAHNVGSAIDVLALKNAGSHNVVVEEIRHLEATLTLQLTKIAQRLDASDAGPPQ
jgi:GAF domain-containing protein